MSGQDLQKKRTQRRPGAKPRTAEQFEKAFWGYVDKSGGPSACWPWTAGRGRRGYGKAWRRGRTLGAHKIAFELTVGPVADGMYVCHHCDNPPCCNPTHLYVGTPKQNTADSVLKGRRNTPTGERLPHTVLSESKVADILERHSNGARVCDLATQYGVSRSAIYSVVTGKNWTRVSALRAGAQS